MNAEGYYRSVKKKKKECLKTDKKIRALVVT